jgi:hypothetical protein
VRSAEMTQNRAKANPPQTPVTRAARTMWRGLLVGLCFSALAFAVLAASGKAEVLGGHRTDADRSHFGGPVAHAARARGPALRSPVDDAVVDAVPAFSWNRVTGAVKYEFELSADRDFGSIVLGQGKGSFQTQNTFATIDKTLPNGAYHWRVRAIDRNDDAGSWSPTRSLIKSWTTQPRPVGPGSGASISYPREALVLRWLPVPRAYKYLVEIATDPSLASPVSGGSVETSGNVFALRGTLSPGRYYWAVTPLDAEKHKGARSAVSSFDWSWPTGTATRIADLNSDSRVFDPQFSWDPVAGAASYEVEINSSQDFALGSKVCCSDLTIGTSLSPKKVLPNNHYYWRVRALDLGRNAGVWNAGPDFDKSFDSPAPPEATIPGLHLRDNETGFLAPGSSTSSPVVAWDPVPGASSYEVQVVPFVLGGCNWTSNSFDTWKQIKTATTAWTPLGGGWNSQIPGGVSYPAAAHDGIRSMVNGQSYCARVLARSDRDAQGQEVVSDWTQLGDPGTPAFTYSSPTPSAPPSGTLTTPAANYRLPLNGSTMQRIPLFTWSRVDGAASYFVVVAKDPQFTDIVDLGFTQVPAYAPRAATGPRTYPDETTTYYWAVMPAKSSNGGNVTSFPWQNSPRSFQKRSVPPALIAPASGSDVITQPTFRWTAAEGAREYRLQVAQDPTFSNLIDDVTTNATAYTSSTTYPADTALYWRVRANDEAKVGLSWSAVGSFRRRLPAPVPNPGNPTSGAAIPVLTWSPVQGATSYDFRVEQPDGVVRDLDFGSNAATFVIFYGTGVWRWQVRANFPKFPVGETPGPYSAVQSFTRRIDAPEGARHVNASKQMLFSWNPGPMIKEYRVQVSARDSFSSLIETHTTENTSYAPRLIEQGYLDGGTIYWRVAATDEGRNLGAWTTRSLTLPKRMQVTVAGLLIKRRRGLVTVTVTDAKRRVVRRAKVRVSGAGIRARPKRTRKNGTVRFKVRPRRRGSVVFRAAKGGYRQGRSAVEIR